MSREMGISGVSEFQAERDIRVAPVLFLIYNRPDFTRRVFEAIREARPALLYVAADGPRAERKGDAEACAEARKIALDVDWDCDVRTLLRDSNLGCRRAVSGGIDWFFENEEIGIILEDDCLPCRSFFRYCTELLWRYRHDERIMQVCGFNPLGHCDGKESYFYSLYGYIWGWASWRRAWACYDVDMKKWPVLRDDGFLEDIFEGKRERRLRRRIYDMVCKGEIDTWDYQWGFAKYINSGLSILPMANMVLNIGMDSRGTHSRHLPGYMYGLRAHEMEFPMLTPDIVLRNFGNDRRMSNIMLNAGLLRRLRDRIIRLVRFESFWQLGRDA